MGNLTMNGQTIFEQVGTNAPVMDANVNIDNVNKSTSAYVYYDWNLASSYTHSGTDDFTVNDTNGGITTKGSNKITYNDGDFTITEDGLYIISFIVCAQAAPGTSIVERHYDARIMIDGIMEARTYSQLDYLESNQSFSSATSMIVKVLTVGQVINFVTGRSYQDNNYTVNGVGTQGTTRGSIVKIS